MPQVKSTFVIVVAIGRRVGRIRRNWVPTILRTYPPNFPLGSTAAAKGHVCAHVCACVNHQNPHGCLCSMLLPKAVLAEGCAAAGAILMSGSDLHCHLRPC